MKNIETFEEMESSIIDILDNCLETIRTHLPFNLQIDTQEENQFFCEVMFCVLIMGMLSYFMNSKKKISDKQKYSLIAIIYPYIYKLLKAEKPNNNKVLDGCIGHRIYIYAEEVKCLSAELRQIKYADVSTFSSDIILTTIQIILPQYQAADLKYKSNPISLCALPQIVTSKYLSTEIEDYVSDIYKAITSFENILDKCKRILKYRNSNLNPFSAYGRIGRLGFFINSILINIIAFIIFCIFMSNENVNLGVFLYGLTVYIFQNFNIKKRLFDIFCNETTIKGNEIKSVLYTIIILIISTLCVFGAYGYHYETIPLLNALTCKFILFVMGLFLLFKKGQG